MLPYTLDRLFFMLALALVVWVSAMLLQDHGLAWLVGHSESRALRSFPIAIFTASLATSPALPVVAPLISAWVSLLYSYVCGRVWVHRQRRSSFHAAVASALELHCSGVAILVLPARRGWPSQVIRGRTGRMRAPDWNQVEPSRLRDNVVLRFRVRRSKVDRMSLSISTVALGMMLAATKATYAGYLGPGGFMLFFVGIIILPFATLVSWWTLIANIAASGYLEVTAKGIRRGGEQLIRFGATIHVTEGHRSLDIEYDECSGAPAGRWSLWDGRVGGDLKTDHYLRIIAATIQAAADQYAEQKRDPYRGQATTPREDLVEP